MRHAMVLLPLGLSAGCAVQETRYEYGGIRMGTRVRIVVHAVDEATARAASAAALARIEVLDGTLSDWRVDNDVADLRVARVGQWITINPDLAHALRLAQRIGDRTGGAFDVTCGRLTARWRLARAEGTLPGTEELDSARAASGWALIEIDPARPRVRFEGPVPWLDFGGIGKGLAADEALTVLRSHGCTRSLVDIGGDIALGEAPAGRTGWSIGHAARSGPDLVLSECGVATSGSGEQHLEVDGVVHSHVFDPRTGRAVTAFRDLTIIAPTAARADALATAGSVLGGAVLRTALARSERGLGEIEIHEYPSLR